MRFEIATCCENNPDAVSSAIMWFQGAPFSHVLVIVDGSRVFHAVGEGVIEQPLEEILKDHHFPHRIPLAPSKRSDDFALGYLHGSLGIAYGLGQYWGFLAEKLPKFLRKWIQRKARNGRAQMVCSEFVADFIQNGLGYETADIDEDFTTPKQVIALAATLRIAPEPAAPVR